MGRSISDLLADREGLIASLGRLSAEGLASPTAEQLMPRKAFTHLDYGKIGPMLREGDTRDILAEHTERVTGLYLMLREECAQDLLACSSIPGFDVGRGGIVENIRSNDIRFREQVTEFWAEYEGERAGPKRRLIVR